MKKLFNLQMFAEETPASAESSAAVATAQEKPIDDKEPETAAEPKKAEAKYTDDDVDKIVKRKIAEMEKKKQKEVDEAKRLAEMDATQKAEYRADQLQKALEEYKRKDTLAEMTKTARKMLADENINIPDDLLSIMVTTEADKTKSAVDGFAKLFKEAVDNAVKERARGTTPQLITNNQTASSEIQKRIDKYK